MQTQSEKLKARDSSVHTDRSLVSFFSCLKEDINCTYLGEGERIERGYKQIGSSTISFVLHAFNFLVMFLLFKKKRWVQDNGSFFHFFPLFSFLLK